MGVAEKSSDKGPRPVFGAAVLLARAPKLDAERVYDALREVVALAGARVRMLDDGARRGILAGLRRSPAEYRFEIAGVRLTVSVSSKPLCNPTTLLGFVNPALWRGGIGRLSDHRAHLLISEDDSNGGSGTDAMFDRATAVTLATAAVASIVEPEAVVWIPARNAVPMGTFGREMERFIDGQAPLEFWIRWQILPAPVQADLDLGQMAAEPLQPGVATLGLNGFIGHEIVGPPSHSSRETMLDQILALASGVIDENAQLTDGMIYREPASGQALARLHMRQSGPYSDRPYWELLPHPSLAPRPVATGDPDAKGRDASGAPRLRVISRNK